MTIDRVLESLRQDMKRRRAKDQPIEAFIIHMQNWYGEARRLASISVFDSVEALQEIACLGLACWEHHDEDLEGRPYTLDDIEQHILADDRIVPLTLQPSYFNYLLKIGAQLQVAEIFAECFNKSSAMFHVRMAVKLCIECFEQHGL